MLQNFQCNPLPVDHAGLLHHAAGPPFSPRIRQLSSVRYNRRKPVKRGTNKNSALIKPQLPAQLQVLDKRLHKRLRAVLERDCQRCAAEIVAWRAVGVAAKKLAGVVVQDGQSVISIAGQVLHEYGGDLRDAMTFAAMYPAAAARKLAASRMRNGKPVSWEQIRRLTWLDAAAARKSLLEDLLANNWDAYRVGEEVVARRRATQTAPGTAVTPAAATPKSKVSGSSKPITNGSPAEPVAQETAIQRLFRQLVENPPPKPPGGYVEVYRPKNRK